MNCLCFYLVLYIQYYIYEQNPLAIVNFKQRARTEP